MQNYKRFLRYQRCNREKLNDVIANYNACRFLTTDGATRLEFIRRIKCALRETAERISGSCRAASKSAREKSIFKRTKDVERMLRALPRRVVRRVVLPSYIYIHTPALLPSPRGDLSADHNRRRVVLIYGDRPADLRISNSRLRGSMVRPGEGRRDGCDAT